MGRVNRWPLGPLTKPKQTRVPFCFPRSQRPWCAHVKVQSAYTRTDGANTWLSLFCLLFELQRKATFNLVRMKGKLAFFRCLLQTLSPVGVTTHQDECLDCSGCSLLPASTTLTRMHRSWLSTRQLTDRFACLSERAILTLSLCIIALCVPVVVVVVVVVAAAATRNDNNNHQLLV